MNNKILKNVPLQRCGNEEFETPDTFLLVPRPSTYATVALDESG